MAGKILDRQPGRRIAFCHVIVPRPAGFGNRKSNDGPNGTSNAVRRHLYKRTVGQFWDKEMKSLVFRVPEKPDLLKKSHLF
jgi:hypothetical protein